jgi:hypothetical protein
MPELDAALRELGRHVEFPPTPDLASAIRGRLQTQLVRAATRRSLFRRAPSADAGKWRRPVAVALAVLVVAIGAVLAVPPARTAILDWLGLRGVSIVRVDELPPTPAVERLDLGRQVTLEEARRAAPWMLVPDDEPDSVYIGPGNVSLLWGTPDRVRLLLTEFRGQALIEKLIEPGTRVERVTVDGKPGAWLDQPHVVIFKDPRGIVRQNEGRLAGKTLLWQHGEVTLRLEGDLSKEEALRIARTAD